MLMTGGDILQFQILGKGVNRTATITLRWPDGGVNNKQIQVTNGGQIREL